MADDKGKAWTLLVDGLCEVLAEDGVDEDDVLPTSTPAELGLTSIEAMHLLIVLEEKGGWELDFRAMLDANGDYRRDMTIGSMFEIIWALVGGATPEEAALKGV